MREWADDERIDSAGMELDRTLLVYDYLNGEPVSRLDDGVADPIGPSAAAAAFDRAAFLAQAASTSGCSPTGRTSTSCSGCGARATAVRWPPTPAACTSTPPRLGSGSARKNYLMGFGRGYVLRKWRVLSAAGSPA